MGGVAGGLYYLTLIFASLFTFAPDRTRPVTGQDSSPVSPLPITYKLNVKTLTFWEG